MKRVACILLTILIVIASLAVAAAEGSVQMQNGSSGDDVAALQQRLILLGYLTGAADGKFGNMTKAAVESFQRANGLNVTGVVTGVDLDALSRTFGGYARRAVVVAMTNSRATDVFAAGGSTYDPAKFHNYANELGYYLTIEDEGSWMEQGRDNWRVEDMLLRIVVYGNYMKVSASVRFDGANYVLSNVTRTIAALEDIDSDDPAKIDTMKLEPSASTPFLTVPHSLVAQERESVAAEQRAAAAEAVAAAKETWIANQFNPSDGSHKALQGLIIEKMNAQSGYVHLETTHAEITDDSVKAKINLVLQASKFIQRVEVGDLFINTKFMIHRADGGVYYGLAYAIARYDDDSLTLLGIVDNN